MYNTILILIKDIDLLLLALVLLQLLLLILMKDIDLLLLPLVLLLLQLIIRVLKLKLRNP